ncbi:MAG: DUF1592 domain-containing protein [Verrucomicrobiota bacterium]
MNRFIFPVPPRRKALGGRGGWVVAAVALILGMMTGEQSRADEAVRARGAEIYRQMCVECHGPKGEGVPGKHDEALFGDRTVAALARRIEKTMPEDKEGTCVGPDADAVAYYIYHAFYSMEARAALVPVKREESRLTVNQYRMSVADVIGHFQREGERLDPNERGLKAGYFGDAGFRGSKEKEGKDTFERRDAAVSFDFGGGSPDEAVMGSEQFSIKWTGAVIAEATGLYEFTVKTQNGARLWVNDDKNPLIDGWVSSGPEIREEKASIYLLGGRAYPLRLEYFKFKEKAASVQLLWKPPHSAAEVIPARNLSPARRRPVFAVGVPFPADDRSSGYERGTSVSRAWYDAVTAGSVAAATYVSEHLQQLAGVDTANPDRVPRLKEFSRNFVSTAWRRPVTDAEFAAVADKPFATAPSPEVAVKRVVLAALMSPRFLFPEAFEPETPDGHTVASRLALALWDSVPDEKLARLAAEGKLTDRGEIDAQARRMTEDPRAHEKLRGFFQQWLGLKEPDAIVKDPAAFPNVDLAVFRDLKRSLDLFIDGVVWSPESDYRRLLNADYLLLNSRLAPLYGREVAAGGDFQPVSFPGGERVGVMTHPYLLTSLSYLKASSPIHRGVFMTRSIVGRMLKAPPEAVEFHDADFDPTFTMREKVTELTKPANCMGCHATINPLGFTLEHYDALGRWRTEDNGKPVNAASDFPDDEGAPVPLKSAQDVAAFAIGSGSAHRTFIRHLFQHTVKQPTGAYGSGTMSALEKKFTDSGFSVRELLVRSAVTAAVQGLPVENRKETAAQ